MYQQQQTHTHLHISILYSTPRVTTTPHGIRHNVIQCSHHMSISLNASLGHIIPIVQARTSIHAVKLPCSRAHAAIGHVLTSV